jgi:predicted kinase
MSIPHLLLLIGLPGSGKSTYATAWAAADAQRRIVATDAIRLKLFGDAAVQGSWLQVECEVARQFREVVRADALDVAPHLSAVMYDATNARQSYRRQAIALARTCGFTSITGLWITTPLEVALARNRRRDRPVPEPVILQMYQDLLAAPPGLADGLDVMVQLWQPELADLHLQTCA